MSMPQNAVGAAYLSQTLGSPSLAPNRTQEVADLVAGLSDLGLRVADLGSMVTDAEQQLRKLASRAQMASSKRTAAARSLEEMGWADDFEQGKRQLRRLREALHDAQQDMEALSAEQGATGELDMLRAQCQQDDLRARALEAELLERVSQEFRRVEMQQSQRRRQEQSREGGGASLSGSHLQAETGTGDDDGMGWQPPEELAADFEDVAQRASNLLRNEARKSESREDAFDAAPTTSAHADVQARLANVLMHPKMPRFTDPSDMVQWVIRQAHSDGGRDIQHYAHKLHFSTLLKEAIREELSRARRFRSEHGAKPKDGVMDVAFARVNLSRDPVLDEHGVPQVRPPEPAGDITRVDELDAHISDLQNMLASTGEDMQLSNLELQHMTQRQQQVMNVMSNLSKALHETSMSIIRKIGN